MTDSNENGMGVKTQAVTDEEGRWYTLLTLQLGILSTSIALPVDAVPGFAANLRKAILDGYKDTITAQAQAKSNDIANGKLVTGNFTL